MGYWKSHIFIILPQALKLVIPGIANTFIALFKDTTMRSVGKAMAVIYREVKVKERFVDGKIDIKKGNQIDLLIVP